MCMLKPPTMGTVAAMATTKTKTVGGTLNLYELGCGKKWFLQRVWAAATEELVAPLCLSFVTDFVSAAMSCMLSEVKGKDG